MKISAEKLQEIIESHGRWLRNEEGGERANLRSADLRSADLDKTYYQVVRVGSRRGITTYCVDDDNVLCGCWNGFKGGTLDEFKTRVESVYGREGNNPKEQYYDEYMAAITFFAAMKEMK